MADLDATLLRKIDEAIRSEAGESAMSIYRRFGLAQRGIHDRTFGRYVATIRSVEWTDAVRPAPPTMERIREELLIAIYESAQAGGMKAYEMASLLARVQEEDRNEIRKAAEKRAGEIHEQKLAAFKKAQDDALDVEAEKQNLSPEQVREIRHKVLGLA